MRYTVVAGACVAAAFVTGCGGNGGGGASVPTGPSTPAPTTITIVGERGNQSFNPNPATAGQGQMLVWRNTDNVVHRIKFNDDPLDTGDIAPGASSTPRAMPTAGANYHCLLHPEMVGAIRASTTAPPPPCEGQYC